MESKRLFWAATALLLAMLALQEGIHPTPRGAYASAAAPRQDFINMVFYMHDLPEGPNPTSVRVAAQKGDPSPKFGATNVFDDKLTEGPDPNSTEVGRGQGLYTLASLTSIDVLLTFTVVLHEPAIYNGSTISLHGSNRILVPGREISVIGGTGLFRFARGYAILTNIASDGINAVVKFNLTMLL